MSGGERVHVFVSGPYTLGDVAANVSRAIDVATELLDLGFAPYLPHLSHFWHLQHQRPYETWMELDAAWLRQCHCMLRIPGESSGADAEEEEAGLLGIPVYYGVHELCEAYRWTETS